VLNRDYMWNKIISAAERVLKLVRNYHSDAEAEHAAKYSWAAIINRWNKFEIILRKFPRAEIKLLRQGRLK